MKTLLLLLLIPACNSTTAPEVTWKDTPSVEAPPVAAPVYAPHALEPTRAASAPPPELLAADGDAGAPKPHLEANGCLTGMRDLGACCAPQLKPGGCDCRTGSLCARSCEYDSNHVANVDVFCQDGGI